MKVLKTVYRGFGQTFKYCDAGQKVNFISDHGNVLIVQDINGLKFPVMKTDVSEDVNAEIIETKIIEAETIIIKKKVKPIIQNSNQLF